MRAFGRAAVLAVAVGVSVPVSAAEIMISWHFENGETAIENRQMVEKDGRHVMPACSLTVLRTALSVRR